MLTSVVVPLFNKAPLLLEALDSIVSAARTDGDAELVFVDHGSTDGSYELLRSFSAVASVRQLRGGTISRVRNEGARHSRGEILSFIDCDCIVPEGYFRALRHVFASPDVAATGCECDIPSPAHWTEQTWHSLH